VVKSFNQTAARQLAEKRPPEFGKRVIFVASNDTTASAAVAGLCTELGLAPIELGRLDGKTRCMRLSEGYEDIRVIRYRP